MIEASIQGNYFEISLMSRPDYRKREVADHGKRSIPEWVRTTNLRLRRPTRYPIAPRGHKLLGEFGIVSLPGPSRNKRGLPLCRSFEHGSLDFKAK
jgi:hypothetical protein